MLQAVLSMSLDEFFEFLRFLKGAIWAYHRAGETGCSYSGLVYEGVQKCAFFVARGRQAWEVRAFAEDVGMFDKANIINLDD